MWIVTGATGFIGGHLCEALGTDARGLRRDQVDDWRAAKLERLFAGAEGVIHAASVVHRPGTAATDYERVNVEGTRAVVEAARAAGVRRVVQLSSIKVYGEHPIGVMNEHTVTNAEADYARTKARADEVVLGARDLSPIVLRLCPVFGRGEKGNVRRMIREIQRRRFFVPGNGATRKSIVHVSTVVDVIRAAMNSPADGVFVVSNRNTPSIRELADAIAKALGRRPPLGLPHSLLLRAATIADYAARVVGRTSPVTRELVEKSLTNSVCDPSRTEQELGVTCTVDLDWALRDEIAWLRNEGLL